MPKTMAHGIEDMSAYKMTLRPWLWSKIERGGYMGLEWLDRDQLQFKLPWVKENDPNAHQYYKLFHDWDQRDGNTTVKKSDQIVKRNFRSVLNKSPHFKKLELVEQQTGSYKIYQFLMPEDKREHCGPTDPRNVKHTMQLGVSECADLSSMSDVHDHARDMFSPECTAMNMQVDTTMNVPDQVESFAMDASISSSFSSDINNDLMKSKLLEAGIKSFDLPTCTMTVSYSGCEVLSMKLNDMRQGYKVSFADKGKIEEFKLLSGTTRDDTKHKHNITLPNHDTGTNFQKILWGVGPGGVDFWFDDEEMCIMMKRLCQSHVFYATTQSDSPSEPQKVKRGKTVELFSYKKFFYSLFTSQVDGGPQNEIFFVIGTKPKMTEDGGSEGVRITLRPDALNEFLLRAADSLKEVCISEPQPIDCLLYAAHISEMVSENVD